MTVHDQVREGEYKSKLVYPERPHAPKVLGKRASELTSGEMAELPQVKQAYETAKTAYTQSAALYREDEGRLLAKFREDLELEFGTKDHPKAGVLFSKAWEHGHSSGLGEVYTAYEDLAELLDLSPGPGMSPR
jgi:hypothetical protein